MTKEEFKQRWESNDDGGGITSEDIADCAKEWGLFDRPRICEMQKVIDAVLKYANTSYDN